jgi:hypothetical protein
MISSQLAIQGGKGADQQYYLFFVFLSHALVEDLTVEVFFEV